MRRRKIVKVVFVTHRYPPRTGGVETHVREVSVRLVERGHDVTVFSADAGSDVPSKQDVDGVQVRRFRSLHPDGAFYIAPQVTRAVRRADADVVHAHNYHALPLSLSALGVSDERFVVTTHYHGGSANSVRNALLSMYRPFGRRVLRRADDVTAVSDWERDELREDFGVNATVVPNGIDVQRFRTATPEGRERPYLLCVGRIEKYKGIQHIVRALPEMPNFDLLVAGDGDYTDTLKRIASRAGVDDRVEFLGYVPDERLPALYAGASVYVTLSTFEAYGMTVGEALAAGTPCVVLEQAALVDWTRREDVLGVPRPTATEIANAVETAVGLTAPVESLPTWDDVTDRYLSLYQ